MENIKKIKVADLVKNYNDLTSIDAQENYIKSIVIRSYMPVLGKKLVIQNMFDKSIVNENGNIYVDMFINKINITFGILTMYTKLDFTRLDEEDASIFDDYDLLVESDLLNKIFAHIPEKELTQILTINDQVHETFYNKYKSTEAFVNSLINRFSTASGLLIESANNYLTELMKDKDTLNAIIKGLK